MAPPGAQPDLADDAGFGLQSHNRNDSVATQATLVAGVTQPGANALDRALKGATDSDDIHVVDNQRFRVTAGTPAGPTAATTASQTGSPTAAAPQNVPIDTTAALAVVDPTTTADAGPNEGPSGAHAAAAATGVADYEESSDDDFDYDQLDYDNVFCLPPGYKMIPIPIGKVGPDDCFDENGRACRLVRIDDPTQDVDEDADWVLSGGAQDDSANANGEDNEDEGGNDDGNDGDNDEEGGNDSDLDSNWKPPAVLPKGPDAAGTIGWSDAHKQYNRERVAKETVAAGKVAPTVPLPPNFEPVPQRPEPDNILRPPWWKADLEKHIAAPLAPPDDAQSVLRPAKRKRVDEEEDEPVPRAHKKARLGKEFNIDEVCAKLDVVAWTIGVCGNCARWTDGRRDELPNDAEDDVAVDADGQNNSEHGGEADEYDEEADWVLQP